MDGDAIALAYYNELQKTPGYEVTPVGVVVAKLQAWGQPINEATDFPALARYLGVDAIIVGAVTDYESYYPPRIGLTTNWYAANPYFHEIPPGYGLPWGTAEEEYIPQSLVFEAEFALAKAQLRTQTPYEPIDELKPRQPKSGAGGKGSKADKKKEAPKKNGAKEEAKGAKPAGATRSAPTKLPQIIRALPADGFGSDSSSYAEVFNRRKACCSERDS